MVYLDHFRQYYVKLGERAQYSLSCYLYFTYNPWINYTGRFLNFGYLQNFLFWSGSWPGFSNIQEFLYMRIFKVQSLSDRGHGRFIQYVVFKVLVLLMHIYHYVLLVHIYRMSAQ